MSFANYISARILEPNFKKYTYSKDKFGAGIDAVWGITEEGKTEIQAIRFNKVTFDIPKVRSWLSQHKFQAIKIEPAKGKVDEDGEAPVATPVASTETSDIAVFAPKIGDIYKRISNTNKKKKLIEGTLLEKLEILLERREVK